MSFPAAASADVNMLNPACSYRPLASSKLAQSESGYKVIEHLTDKSVPDSLTRTKQSTGMLLRNSILDVVVEDADVLLFFYFSLCIFYYTAG